MDVTRMAEIAMVQQRAQAGQEASVAMVKQQLQSDQAIAQVVTQATEASKAAAQRLVDIEA